MKSHSLLLRILLALAIVLQASCATQALNSKYSYTPEHIGGFYITADEKTLAVIGEKYHYLFPLRADLKYVLGWNERSKIRASFGAFELLPEGKVAGSYSLLVAAKDIDEDTRNVLRGVGFTESKGELRLDGKLVGSYFQPADTGPLEHFSHPYPVTLKRDTELPTAVRVPLTPVAIAADGAMYIGGAVLLSLYCGGSSIAGKKCFPSGL